MQSKCEMIGNGQQLALFVGECKCAEAGEVSESLKSLQFVLKLYETQRSEGRYFMHAPPEDSSHGMRISSRNCQVKSMLRT